MYRKFEFAAQPFFERNPAVQHPDFELIFSGVMEINIDGERDVIELFINRMEYPMYAPGGKIASTADWHKFRNWLQFKIDSCPDSDEAQSKITLPPGNMYDEMYPPKPSGSARWFDPSGLTAENAAQFAAIMGEVKAVGDGLVVTEFTHKTFN